MPQRAKDSVRQREVAARLRAVRTVLNYEQFKIAKLIGISPQRWSYYENGKRQFDFDKAVELCEKVGRLRKKKIGLTLDYIYRGEKGIPVDQKTYRRLQRLARIALDDDAAQVAAAAIRGKRPPRAKGEKAATK